MIGQILPDHCRQNILPCPEHIPCAVYFIDSHFYGQIQKKIRKGQQRAGRRIIRECHNRFILPCGRESDLRPSSFGLHRKVTCRMMPGIDLAKVFCVIIEGDYCVIIRVSIHPFYCI